MDSELVQRTERVAKALDVLAKNAAAAEVRGVVPPLYLSLLKAASAMKRSSLLGALEGLHGSARSLWSGLAGRVGQLHSAVADPVDMITAAVRKVDPSGTNPAAIEELLRRSPIVQQYVRQSMEAVKRQAMPGIGSLALPASAAIAAGGVGYGLGRGPVQQDRGRPNLPVVYAS